MTFPSVPITDARNVVVTFDLVSRTGSTRAASRGTRATSWIAGRLTDPTDPAAAREALSAHLNWCRTIGDPVAPRLDGCEVDLRGLGSRSDRDRSARIRSYTLDLATLGRAPLLAFLRASAARERHLAASELARLVGRTLHRDPLRFRILEQPGPCAWPRQLCPRGETNGIVVLHHRLLAAEGCGVVPARVLLASIAHALAHQLDRALFKLHGDVHDAAFIRRALGLFGSLVVHDRPAPPSLDLDKRGPPADSDRARADIQQRPRPPAPPRPPEFARPRLTPYGSIDEARPRAEQGEETRRLARKRWVAQAVREHRDLTWLRSKLATVAPEAPAQGEASELQPNSEWLTHHRREAIVTAEVERNDPARSRYCPCCRGPHLDPLPF